MGGSTDKHRLSLSIDSDLWGACSEISRQTGMNWSAVAAEAFSLYVRYFAPRDRVIDEDSRGEYEFEQWRPLHEAVRYFNDGGVFRANPSFCPTDIPVLQLADDMPYHETPQYYLSEVVPDSVPRDHAMHDGFYRSCSG